MKIALAQIDMRLGDIEGVCARIESQAILAHEQEADLLAVPVPLLAGILPGSLIEVEDFEHDMVSALSALAERLDQLDIAALVPAVVAYEGAALLEVFVLDRGHVVPVRSLFALRHDPASGEAWAPPVFDIAGVRVALTFDMHRDISLLPPGCDVLVYFQANAFDVVDEETAAVAAVADGHFAEDVARSGVWLAYMAPVGAYDEAVYTGGSFVMDEGGRVVAAAPCFEEALLVQEVRRGEQLPCVERRELPQYQRELWLWEGLCLAVRDTARARGCHRAALRLSGDLPSSLAAALCVDALGPRNVIGVFTARSNVFTPAQEAEERERVELVRTLAAHLHIPLVEREAPDLSLWADRDVPTASTPRLHEHIEGLFLEDVARQEHALPVSALTKTEAALAAPAHLGGFDGVFAPFGDIYLTELEFLARMRNRAGEAVPSRLVTLNAVEHTLEEILARAMTPSWDDTDWSAYIAQTLSQLEPAQVDGVLEAHVDRMKPFEELPLAATQREATALLLMLVRQGEYARRMLPSTPIVSGRSFSERCWPTSLAWSDLGKHGEEVKTIAGLVQAEVDRLSERGEDMGERMRDEVMGFIGGMLGLTQEQLDELRSEEGRRKIQENLKQFEEQVQDVINRMVGEDSHSASAQQGKRPPFPPGKMPSGHGFPFFSDN